MTAEERDAVIIRALEETVQMLTQANASLARVITELTARP